MGSLLDAVGARALRTRGLARAPVRLYRLGLGRLLGDRLLMLEHTGRISGLPRSVCLEVVERPAPDTIVVVSGFGPRAQWYRNLLAEPRCAVTTGRLAHVPALARAMGTAESAATLRRYASAHPRAWTQLRGTIEHAVGHPVDDLPMMELSLARTG